MITLATFIVNLLILALSLFLFAAGLFIIYLLITVFLDKYEWR